MRMLPSRLLVLTALLSLSVLSGCGNSSDKNTKIPSSEEIYYQYSAFLNHSTVMTSGYNRYGQLGDGTLNNRYFFLPVSGLNQVKGVSAGANHVLAYQGDAVWAWGSNVQGRLGTEIFLPTAGGSAFANVPRKINLAGPIYGVSAGANHSLAIAGANRTVYAWGGNSSGQLANGTVVDSAIPAPVKFANSTTAQVAKVAAGGFHSLALSTDGELYGWGGNSFGQLAALEGTPFVTLVQHITTPLAEKINDHLITAGVLPASADRTVLPAGVSIADIAAAGSYSLALIGAPDPDGGVNPYKQVDGTVWGWGYNGYGQLGQRKDATSPAVPAPITKLDGKPLTGVKKVSAGLMHVVALVATANGNEVWTWGFGEKGQLGNKTTILFSSAPLKASILDLILNANPGNIEDVQAFGNQSFAKIGGKWYGWGDNGWGQLGQPVPTGSVSFLLEATALGF